MLYDIIIIGGGPAGTAAAVYTARKRLKTLLITEAFGGQSLVSDDIQNWIGEAHISGYDLAKKFEAHVRAFPDMVDVRMPEKAMKVEAIKCVSPGIIDSYGINEPRVCDFLVTTNKNNTYEGKAVILAAGARRRRLGVPGEDKFDGKGVAFCSTCLPPDESVIANSSVQEITRIQSLQTVLTHDGSFQKVTETMERAYEGDLVEIRPRFFSESVRLTPNHPVLATTISKGNAGNYWRDFKINEPEWIRADMLTRNNAVLYPVVSETREVESVLISEVLKDKVEVVEGMVKNKKESPTAVRIPDKIKASGTFLRLAGYFLAEGTITKTGVNLYFSKRERTLAEDVARITNELFGLKTYHREEGNVLRVQIYSKIISAFFEDLFGKHAHNKKVPHWMVLLPPEKQKEVVKGFYRGDGCKRDKDFCLVTNSRVLVYQLRDILLRAGILPAIQRRSVAALNKTVHHIQGRAILFRHDKYHIIVGGPWLQKMSNLLGVHHERADKRRTTCHHAWIDEKYAYLPLRDIRRVPYKGVVRNLAVDKNNTYIAKNFIVHNCDAPLFSGKTVAVVGGGNAGLEAVVDLFPYAEKIYLCEYGERLKGDPVTQEEIKKNPKVEIVYNAKTLEILGEQFVTGLKYLDTKANEEKTLAVNGVFVEIGSVPNSEMVSKLVKRDRYGQVLIDSKHASTSHAGIFAAGDITDDPYKQNNISAGDAVKAALAAYNYLFKREKISPAAEKF